MPPSTWPLAVIGLMATPQSTAITIFTTVTWPVSMSTSSSTNWAANGGGQSGETCEPVPMICSCSLRCSESRAISARLTDRPSGAQAFLSRNSIEHGASIPSNMAARSLSLIRTTSAAFFAAVPEM